MNRGFPDGPPVQRKDPRRPPPSIVFEKRNGLSVGEQTLVPEYKGPRRTNRALATTTYWLRNGKPDCGLERSLSTQCRTMIVALAIQMAPASPGQPAPGGSN